jgi:hypothetical protein
MARSAAGSPIRDGLEPAAPAHASPRAAPTASGRAAHRPPRRVGHHRPGSRHERLGARGDHRHARQCPQVARLQPPSGLATSHHTPASHQGADGEPLGSDYAGPQRRGAGRRRTRGGGARSRQRSACSAARWVADRLRRGPERGARQRGSARRGSRGEPRIGIGGRHSPAGPALPSGRPASSAARRRCACPRVIGLGPYGKRR